MTLPIPSNVFSDGQLINEALLYTNVFAPINTVYQLASASGGFLYGEAEGTNANSVTLSSGPGSTNYLVPNAAVTIVLSATRRVRAIVRARVTPGAATAGAYALFVTWVAGSTATLTGATLMGQAGGNQIVTPATSGGAGAVSNRAEYSILFAAGTYTIFPVVQKSSGGNAADASSLGYTAVYDAGNV